MERIRRQKYHSAYGITKHTSFCTSRKRLLCSKKDCIYYFLKYQHTLFKVIWVMWVTTDSSCHLCVLTTGASVLQNLSKWSCIINIIHTSSQTSTLVRSWWSWTCDWPFSWPKPVTISLKFKQICTHSRHTLLYEADEEDRLLEQPVC